MTRSLATLIVSLLMVGCSAKHTGNTDRPQRPMGDNPSKNSPSVEIGKGKVLPQESEHYKTIATANQIKLMSYNLENLFDAEHDEGKEDYYYLPISHPLKATMCPTLGSYAESCLANDWNENKIEMKLEQLARVIRSSGSLPDVIGVQEVENEKILSRLGQKLGYTKNLITDGPDGRGIKVGFLYKEEKLSLIEHNVFVVDVVDPNTNQPTRATRNVREAIFKLKIGGDSPKYLATYVNHWPSQGTPMSGWKRTSAAMAVKKGIDLATAKYGKENLHVVVLGDFNTLPRDRPHPFHSVLLDSSWENALENDVQWSYLFDTAIKSGTGRSAVTMPLGTYFYRRDASWNKFDRFFPSKNLSDGTGLEVIHNSFRVISSPETSEVVTLSYNTQGYSNQILVPNRFNSEASDPVLRGASDHFAVTVLLGL